MTCRKKQRVSEEYKHIDENKVKEQQPILTEAEEKKKADSLWSGKNNKITHNST